MHYLLHFVLCYVLRTSLRSLSERSLRAPPGLRPRKGLQRVANALRDLSHCANSPHSILNINPTSVSGVRYVRQPNMHHLDIYLSYKYAFSFSFLG